ncbi:BspA family leucine-rich repeat surface protein [Erysipelothrix aquatica]|uniref:BspA family leucine-rich repeat surface protein n=1 Tax=Erysipelothrix aquatica TaxID=2683714 RepID=UPI00135CB572|nr:BspA family leucine-rich repeat surface protein [Erysipelothrix aquatica]
MRKHIQIISLLIVLGVVGSSVTSGLLSVQSMNETSQEDSVPSTHLEIADVGQELNPDGLDLEYTLNESDQLEEKDSVDANETIEASEKSINQANVVESVWGSSKVIYNIDTATLDVYDGLLENKAGYEFLDNQNQIVKSQVKTINLHGDVFTPKNADLFFAYPWSSLEVINGNLNTSLTESMMGMFERQRTLKTIDVSQWDTSNVTDMAFLFSQSGVTALDVSKWDTRNVVTLNHAFNGTGFLKELDVSEWDTSNVSIMSFVFSYTAVESLDVHKWNTSNVTTMSNMFAMTQSLTHLEGKLNWDTSKVTKMDGMFIFSGLSELDLSNFDTSNVTDMDGMFGGMENLETLDIGSFDTSKVTNAENIFGMDEKLNRITLGAKTTFQSFYTGLPLISTESGEYTGGWIRIIPESPFTTYSSSDIFMESFNGNLAGTYVWERPIKNGQLIVEFVDTEGNVLTEQSISHGPIGSSYIAKSKTINGYTLIEVIGLETGQFSTEVKHVKFIYSKDEDPEVPGPVDPTNPKPVDPSPKEVETLPNTGQNPGNMLWLGTAISSMGAFLLIMLKTKTHGRNESNS